MNVVRNAAAFPPPRMRYEGNLGQRSNVPLTNHQLDTKRKRLAKRFEWASEGRGRGQDQSYVAISSSLVTSRSRNRTGRSGTRTTTGGGSSSLLESGTVLALTTGRGDARSEVGMAALDIRCPHLILCQISDSQSYRNALSKLYLFEPIEVLMPDTMCERGTAKSVLYRSIMDKFPELGVTGISRVHFNAANGLERVKSLCNAEYSSVELFVKQKYYALAAVAALLKYVEYAQRIVYAAKSMKIEFQGSPNATSIDLESARSLELVQSQCGQRNVSLLGVLDRCLTPMGRKLLRANILQPPCEERTILKRQDAVAELASNRSLRALVQPIVRRLYGADRLLTLSTTPVLHENNVQCAEHNLNYVLLLKNLLDVVPELERVLLSSESEILREIQKRLHRDEFRAMREKILATIHPDARSVTGYTSSSMQRCFAIKAGINDLLDVARQTYCELIDDMKTMVENLASKYKLNLCLSCNASLGYHVQAILPRNMNATNFHPPAEFIEVRKSKRAYTMTTGPLATFSQQCKIACEELHLMSNVLLCDLLENIRGYVGCMFELSADVAELDLILSLSQISSLETYARPTFGVKLELCDSRHPVMDVFGLDALVPNDITASIPRNFCVISGPNMSGKSTYLKQIVLLHVMAQIGCFVPARKATFRITDLVFCKIAARDDIEYNASTFALEMKEAQYILRSVTPTSLIVLDELCKGTAVEEGASIAWAICEKLCHTTAFIFAATHFFYLTKLADLYCNVINAHFETVNVQRTTTGSNDCHPRLIYTHRLKHGVAPTDDYGIRLAELSGLPKAVTDKARKYASEQIVDRIVSKPNVWQEKCYHVLVRLYELLETNEFHREQASSLVECFLNLWKQKDTSGEEDERSEVAASKAVIYPGRSFNESKENTRRSERISTKNEWEGTVSLSARMIVGPHSSTNSPLSQTESLRLQNDLLDSERDDPFNHSFNLTDSLSFCSITTETVANKSEKLVAPSDSITPSSNHFHAKFQGSTNSASSIIDRAIPSPSFTRESSSMQRSISRLYEYCLSDDDFQPFNISSTSNIFQTGR